MQQERIKKELKSNLFLSGLGPQIPEILSSFLSFLSIYSFFVFYLIQVSKFIFESVFKKHIVSFNEMNNHLYGAYKEEGGMIQLKKMDEMGFVFDSALISVVQHHIQIHTTDRPYF
ncbi:hypothetical protein ACJX0J_012782 [Zea mays]